MVGPTFPGAGPCRACHALAFRSTPAPAPRFHRARRRKLSLPCALLYLQGGKLPGLAGGPTGCGGGASAYDCWSVRIMWRRQGMGEAYVYVPGGEDGWQAPDFCSQPPQTICDWHAGAEAGAQACWRRAWPAACMVSFVLKTLGPFLL